MILRLRLITAIQDAADELERRGVLQYAWKRRDGREPGRREKEAAEDALMLFFRRHFRRQEKLVRERAGTVVKADPIPLDDIFEMDEGELAELIRLLTQNTRGGISLFGASTGIDIDYTATNLEAAEWARKYAGKLIKNIDKLTLETVRSALQMFVETPGFSIGDLMDLLPFSEERALKVAVTEVTNSYKQGQMMAGQELKDQFPDVRVVKRWMTNADDRVCDLCFPLDGKEIDFEDTFYEPENEYQDGDPPRHVACLLPGQKIIIPGNINAAAKTFYSGAVIEMSFANGSILTVTPNHPILTLNGWKSAHLIQNTDYILCASKPERMLDSINPYNDHRPIIVEEIFSSLKESGQVFSISMPTSSKQFYGDGRGCNGNVDIVGVNGFLRDRFFSQFCEPFNQVYLSGRDIPQVRFNSFGPGDFNSQRLPFPLNGNMGSFDLISSLFGSHPRPFERFHFGLSAGNYSIPFQPSMEGVPTYTDKVRQFMFRFPGEITINPVLRVRNYNWSGHVYDLQNDIYGLYICNGIIVKNCRCWIETSTALAKP